MIATFIISVVHFCRSDPEIKWEIKSQNGSAAVTAVECYGITGEGGMDLIIGKDDGYIEIYTYDEHDKPKYKQCFVNNFLKTCKKCFII